MGNSDGISLRYARHTRQITIRHLRLLVRRPAFVAITVVQPLMWLLMFGELFGRIVALPGFHEQSYVTFITPGIVMLTAMSFASWTGMPCIEDMRTGVMDRFVVSPVWRPALTTGSVMYTAIMVTAQSLLILLLAVGTGAHLYNGVAGVASLTLVGVLLGCTVSAASNGLAILVRQRETLIGIVTLVTWPVAFASSAFMPVKLVPHWIQLLEKVNPVNWAVTAGRGAASQHPDWTLVGGDAALLAVLLVMSVVFADGALRYYIRTR